MIPSAHVKPRRSRSFSRQSTRSKPTGMESSSYHQSDTTSHHLLDLSNHCGYSLEKKSFPLKSSLVQKEKDPHHCSSVEPITAIKHEQFIDDSEKIFIPMHFQEALISRCNNPKTVRFFHFNSGPPRLRMKANRRMSCPAAIFPTKLPSPDSSDHSENNYDARDVSNKSLKSICFSEEPENDKCNVSFGEITNVLFEASNKSLMSICNSEEPETEKLNVSFGDITKVFFEASNKSLRSMCSTSVECETEKLNMSYGEITKGLAKASTRWASTVSLSNHSWH